jgi:signal transduction histidine kinase
MMSEPAAFPLDKKPRLVSALTGSQFQFGLILLTLIALVLFGSSVFIYRPYDGLAMSAHFERQILYVYSNGPAEKAGLLAGDQILSVDGQPVDPWLQKPLYHGGLKQGQLVTYEIERGTEVFTVTAALGRYTDNLLWILPVTLTLVMAALFWVVGLTLALFAGQDNFPARLLASGWLLAGAAGAAGGPGVFSHFWYAHSFMEISWVFLAFLLVSAHLHFPAPSLTTRARKAAIWALFGLTAILSAMVSIEEFILKPRSLSLHAAGIDISDFVYIFFFLAILTSLLLLLMNRFKSRDTEIRRQTGIVLGGTLLGFGPFITLTLLPRILFGPGLDYPDGSVTILFLVLMPLAYIYVIFQRRLLRIDFLINRFVVFFVLSLLVMTISFSLAAALALLFNLPGSLPLIASLITLVVFLPSAALQEKAHKWVSRMLYGNYYDHASVTSLLSEKLAQTNDRSTLTTLLTKTLAREMLLYQVALLLRDGERLELQGDMRQPLSIPVNDPLCQSLQESRCPLRIQDFSDQGAYLNQNPWNQLRWGMLFAPILFENELRGILVLGARQSGDMYPDQDVRIIATVTHQAALALANVQLVETLRDLAQQLVRADEQHRTKVARELHDTVLQDLFIINQRLNNHPWDPEMKEHLGAVIEQLREIIDEQHPKWLKSGLILTLSGLVNDMQRMRGDEGPRIDFMSGVDELDLLAEEISVSIYRIVKEAVVNAWKHAHAGKICVKIEKTLANTLCVSVEDDGIGLPPLQNSRNGKYGLTNMKERAKMINANLVFSSREGLGTIVSLEIKL